MREVYRRMEIGLLKEYAGFLEPLKEFKDADEMKRVLDEKRKSILEEINADYAENEALYGRKYDITPFKDDILCHDASVTIRKPAERDRTPFIEVKKAYAVMKSAYDDPGFLEQLWEEHLGEESLYYSIIRTEDDTYIGYCGIKDVRMRLWEIVIELGTEYCRQGYGFRSLSMFLDRISELSGRNEFRSRVAPDNTASQRLIEKAGFQIIGLSDCYGMKEDEKSRIEKNIWLLSMTT